jgi:hypothetical protein
LLGAVTAQQARSYAIDLKINMGNTQTKEAGFISAGVNGNTSYVRQAMQADLPARERLLSAHTGFFAGKKTVLHVAAKAGKADVIASGEACQHMNCSAVYES